jgi:hypothetical protein
MEVFDRSLTNIPIELHTNYISNFQNKDIPVPDQFVWSGSSENDFFTSPGFQLDFFWAQFYFFAWISRLMNY